VSVSLWATKRSALAEVGAKPRPGVPQDLQQRDPPEGIVPDLAEDPDGVSVASKRQQRRGTATHPWHQVLLELVDLGVQFPHPCDQLAGELGNDLVAVAVQAAKKRLDEPPWFR
jgi:hypothetical protein